MLYDITLSDGRTVTVRANSPEEARAAVEQMLAEEAGATAQPTQAPAQPAAPTPLSEASAAVTRGAAPYAGAAALGGVGGFALGGPVLAVPGAVAGAGAMGLSQLVGDPLVESVNRLFGTDFTKPTDALNQLMDAAGLPKPQTAAGRAAQTAVETAAGAGAGAAVGRSIQAAARPGVTREVGRVMAQQPIAQMAGGAAAGGAAQTVAEAGGGPVEQMAAGLVGGGVVGGLVGRASGAQMTGQAPLRADIAEAERRGVPVMTSDIRPPNSFVTGNVRRIGESIPIAGTAGMRSQQEDARINAIRTTLQQFGVATDQFGDDLLTAISQDLRGNRANMLTQLTNQKNTIISRYSTPTQPVVPRSALTFIRNEIARLEGISPTANAPIIAALRQAEVDLSAGKTLQQIEELRRLYRTQFSDPALANIRDAGDRTMSALYNALNTDMGAYIRSRGGQQAEDIWRNANRFLAEMIGDLQNTAFRTALNRGDATPEAIRPVLFSNKTSDLQLLYGELTPVGQATARQAILGHALRRAGNIDDPTAFNANSFERELGKLENQLRVFFPGKFGAEVDGLRRVLRLTQQATTSTKAAAAPTGLQLLPTALGGAATVTAGGPLAGALLLGGAGLIARMYESPAIRNILARLGRVRPGSAEEAELLKRLTAAVMAEQSAEEPQP